MRIRGPRHGWLVSTLLALLAFMAGCGALAYWIIGELPSTGRDYAFGPVHLGVLPLRVLGVVAIVAGGAAAIRLAQQMIQRRLSLAWAPAAVALGLTDTLVAYFWRNYALGVDGANLGAGFSFIAVAAGAVVALPLVVIAGVLQRRRVR